jgi:hypothetical protein
LTTPWSAPPTQTYPPASPTSVWVTATLANGALTTTLSEYVQSFPTFYSTIASPKSGSIGMGTITGQVGVVKPIEYVTLTNS